VLKGKAAETKKEICLLANLIIMAISPANE
jgi:hypothetical protein